MSKFIIKKESYFHERGIIDHVCFTIKWISVLSLFSSANRTCRENEFKCRNAHCVNMSDVCNGAVDCLPYWTDEDFCRKYFLNFQFCRLINRQYGTQYMILAPELIFVSETLAS